MRAWACVLAAIATVSCALASRPAAAADLVETAAATGKFDRLLRAVEAADMTSTLAGNGPYTLLAPTDAAFDTVPYETYRALLQPENKSTLAEVIRYHIVPGAFTASDLAGRQVFLKTAQGQLVFVNGVASGSVQLNERDTRSYNSRQTANLMSGVGDTKGPGIRAENGVIIPIDRVLLPQ